MGSRYVRSRYTGGESPFVDRALPIPRRSQYLQLRLGSARPTDIPTKVNPTLSTLYCQASTGLSLAILNGDFGRRRSLSLVCGPILAVQDK